MVRYNDEMWELTVQLSEKVKRQGYDLEQKVAFTLGIICGSKNIKIMYLNINSDIQF